MTVCTLPAHTGCGSAPPVLLLDMVQKDIVLKTTEVNQDLGNIKGDIVESLLLDLKLLWRKGHNLTKLA
ncbi:hypothetical protein DUI87_09544 [Hirundo rustica rustica]|uniref:Uncharacterized protein n=1 Tax=Hirundo rustica rustica TaxID=333673 RepID=A0A3M0KMG1_HIRRU|nr:hypothetical protein DUI87_09544 [Hirundo rustica rustica]